jgi:CBS domain-containing protein
MASRVGEWIAYGVMGIGVVYTLFGGLLSGLWFLFIGFFLRNASVASYEQLVIESTLSGIAAGDVMRSDVQQVPPDMSVEELVQEGVLRRNARCFAVVAAGEFQGIITLTDVRKVPRDEWASTSVYRAMTPATRLHTVAPGESIAGVMGMMAEHDVNQVPVVRGRQVVGMLDRADLMRLIQVRRDLGDAALPHGASSEATPGGGAAG